MIEDWKGYEIRDEAITMVCIGRYMLSDAQTENLFATNYVRDFRQYAMREMCDDKNKSEMGKMQ